ncbi:MAG: hypothetical protein GXP38_04495 [Chloroflexi bacterium]|nr:hypothetical protein [Chloroflexota bacterium]
MPTFPHNGHVIIIGGGPGGAACALALQRLSHISGRKTQITVIEGKRFRGEFHYNQCAGVLSPPLPSLLEDELDLAFPYHLRRAEIRSYILHTPTSKIRLDGHDAPSISLRRVEFDAYMIEAVRERGIHVVSARASDIEFHDDGVVVYTENSSLTGDVVVGAFGLDDGSAAMFARQTPYRPPQALSSIVTKYHPGLEAIRAFGAVIHAFLPADRRIEFGAVTPKGNHLTINIAGKNVDVPLMKRFLALPEVREVLPNFTEVGRTHENDLRFFKGRFPNSLATHFFDDRYVMIGDAAGLVRAFKGKGVTSAVQTGIRAARCILSAGISKEAFYQGYYLQNKDIISDLPYGRFMRMMTVIMSPLGMLDPVIHAAAVDPQLQTALFDAVSGHGFYREILKSTLRPRALIAIASQAKHIGLRH